MTGPISQGHIVIGVGKKVLFGCCSTILEKSKFIRYWMGDPPTGTEEQTFGTAQRKLRQAAVGRAFCTARTQSISGL